MQFRGTCRINNEGENTQENYYPVLYKYSKYFFHPKHGVVYVINMQ